MSLRNNFLISIFERYSTLVINFVSSIIIARILSPEEIGLFSVAAALLTLAHVIRDFGVGNYLIQEKDLSQDKVATVLGLCVLLSWSIGAVVFVANPYLADFYGDPGVANVLRLLSINFLIIPFSSAIYPLLRRELEYGKLYNINVTSSLTYALVAVMLAYLGYGYMSLAWASLAGVLSTFLFAQYYRPEIAKVLPSLKEWRSIAGFSIVNTSTNMIAAIGDEAPDLIIGKKAGFHSVGIFSRAYGLIMMLKSVTIGGLIPVYQSEMARLNREGGDLSSVYLRGVNLICAFAWPLYGFMALFAESIIVFVYGSAWQAAGALASVLSISLMIDSIFSLNAAVLLGIGKVKQHMVYTVAGNLTKFVLVLLAVNHSLELVAWTFVLSSLVFGVIGFHYVSTIIKISIVELVTLAVKNLLLAGLALVICYILFVEFKIAEGFLMLVGAGVTFVTCWVIAVFLTGHEIKYELEKFMGRSPLMKLKK